MTGAFVHERNFGNFEQSRRSLLGVVVILFHSACRPVGLQPIKRVDRMPKFYCQSNLTNRSLDTWITPHLSHRIRRRFIHAAVSLHWHREPHRGIRVWIYIQGKFIPLMLSYLCRFNCDRLVKTESCYTTRQRWRVAFTPRLCSA